MCLFDSPARYGAAYFAVCWISRSAKDDTLANLFICGVNASTAVLRFAILWEQAWNFVWEYCFRLKKQEFLQSFGTNEVSVHWCNKRLGTAGSTYQKYRNWVNDIFQIQTLCVIDLVESLKTECCAASKLVPSIRNHIRQVTLRIHFLTIWSHNHIRKFRLMLPKHNNLFMWKD